MTKRPVSSFAVKVPSVVKSERQIAIDKLLEQRAATRLHSFLASLTVAEFSLGAEVAELSKNNTFVEFVSKNRKTIGVRKGAVIDYSKDLSSDDEKDTINEIVNDDCAI